MRPFVKMAEEWLVGGVLLAGSPEDVRRCDVHPRQFRDLHLGIVWKAILDVCEAGDEPDVPNVADRLLGMGFLDRIGAEPYLVELTAPEILLNYSRPTALVAHAEIVKTWARNRGVMHEAIKVANAALDGKILPFRRGGVSTEVDIA